MTDAKIVISRRRYRRLMRELARRGGGQRESGAFLLTHATRARMRSRSEITRIVYYDDVDSGSLTGGITMHDVGFAELNAVARRTQSTVVGDVHTHPSGYVRQSSIDAANPMLAFAGHIALIVPGYAQGNPAPSKLGAHQYLGRGEWRSVFGEDVAKILLVRGGLRMFLERIETAWRTRTWMS